MPKEWRQPLQVASALRARLFGRPALFHPRLPESRSAESKPGLYDVTPFRNTLLEMVDFDRLNNGSTRVSVVAVDVETGEEVTLRHPARADRGRASTGQRRADPGLPAGKH